MVIGDMELRSFTPDNGPKTPPGGSGSFDMNTERPSSRREAAMRKLREWSDDPTADSLPSIPVKSPEPPYVSELGEAIALKMIDPPDVLGKYIFSTQCSEKGPVAHGKVVYGNQQALHDLSLKTQLLDQAAGTSNMHTRHRQGGQNQKLHLITQHALLGEYTDRYEDELGWTEPSRYELPDLFQQYSLELTPEDLPTAKPTDSTGVSILLQELATGRPSTRALATLREDLIKMVAGLTEGSEYTEEQVVDPVIQGHEFRRAEVLQFLHREITKTHRKSEELQRRVDNTDVAKENAVRKEDLALAEQYTMENIGLLEDILQHRITAVQQVGLAASDPLTFAGKFEAFAGPAGAMLEALEVERRAFRARVANDIQRLEGKEKEAADKHMEESSVHREDTKRKRADLLATVQEQHQLFDNIVGMLKQLEELGEVHQGHISEFVDARETWERCKADHAQRIHLIPEHRARLVVAARTLDTQLHTLVDMRKYMEESRVVVDQALTKVTAEVDAMTVEEEDTALECFRGVHLMVGELIYKKEQRLLNVDRQVRTLDLQLSMAIETLDDDIPLLREQVKRLQGRQETLRSQLANLRQRSELTEGVFKPIEDRLIRRGTTFAHPALELQELNIERRAKVLDITQRHMAQEQSAVDTQENAMRRMSSTMAVAKQSKDPNAMALVTRQGLLATQ